MGIVAAVTARLLDGGWNLLSLEQHVEGDGFFFMRIRAESDGGTDVAPQLRALAGDLGATVSLHDPARRLNVGVLVTSEPATAVDLLMRAEVDRLGGAIQVVIGNRDDLAWLGDKFDIAFHHVPYEDDAERRMSEILNAAGVELVVLARYMKVLSAAFVDRYETINIHHSFLPSFKGARPYQQAWERGVKVIGATAHYATTDLDEGPIIAQDVLPVTHQYSAAMMAEVGQDVERRVLAQAVLAHLEHRVIVHGKRTIVFQPDGFRLEEQAGA